jgi:hypothetical protein
VGFPRRGDRKKFSDGVPRHGGMLPAKPVADKSIKMDFGNLRGR